MKVYILYSEKGDTFYIGFTSRTVEERLREHLLGYYVNRFTARYDDWKVFFYDSMCVGIARIGY